MRARYDESEIELLPNTITCFLPEHELQCIECSEDYKSTTIFIPIEFFKELKLLSYSRNFQQYYLSPVSLLTEKQLNITHHLTELIEAISHISYGKTSYRREMLISLISVGFELLNVSRNNENENRAHSNRPADIFNQFNELLADHYRESREVNFYAEKLFLTPKYFSKIIRVSTGIPASRWIDDFVTAQAKRILRTRKDITIQEIGYTLGFSEPASFNHFFKRMTGVTPKKFRDSKL